MANLLAPLIALLFLNFSTATVIRNHLKIALFELEPFCKKNANGKEEGFMVDLVKDLLDRVNKSGTQTVTYETYWVQNVTTETGLWDAARYQLLSGLGDLALVPLLDTIGWNGLVELTQPFMLTPFVGLASKQLFDKAIRSGATSFKSDPIIQNWIQQGQLKAIYVTDSPTAGLLQHDQRPLIKNLTEAVGIQLNDTSAQVASYDEAISKLRRNPEKYIILGEYTRLAKYASESSNCDLTFDMDALFGLGGYTIPIGLHVQSQPLLMSINTHLLKMRLDGSIDRLKQKWFKYGSSNCFSGSGQKYEMMTFDF